MSTYFSDASFRFLRSLARHNDKAWFNDHRQQYEDHVRQPFLRLLGDLQPALAEVSEHFRADTRGVGGSLFRIHRDARFSNDKSPYKTWQGARLFHERRREVAAPSFYVHLQPGESFVGAGLWHPEPETQRRVRHFILDNPGSWKAAAHAPGLRKRFDFEESEKLVRPGPGILMPLAQQRRTLGRTGLAVSPVGLGCSGFWGHRRFPEQSAANVVEHALAQGVNLLDTGHNYSGFHAEPRLGRILRPLLKQYPRDALVISSKGGTLTGQAGVSGAEQRNFSPAAIIASCEASLRNLGLDHLDIYQLHGASEHDINDDLLAALQRLRERGLIRHTGINTHSASTLRWMIAHPDAFDVVLLDYNALQQDREPLIDQLQAVGIGVLAGTVLAQGHLLPARPRLPRLADGWYLARAWLKPSSRQLMRSARQMRRAVAAIRSQRPAQTAFAYALGHPGVASGILGTTRTRSLDEVLATRLEALTPAERQQLVDAFGDGRGSPSQ